VRLPLDFRPPLLAATAVFAFASNSVAGVTDRSSNQLLDVLEMRSGETTRRLNEVFPIGSISAKNNWRCLA
jgi:hypothetical protein